MDDTLSRQMFAQIEALLAEQLAEMGVEAKDMDQDELSRRMQCLTYPDGSMEYEFDGIPILRVAREEDDDGTVRYRLFTK